MRHAHLVIALLISIGGHAVLAQSELDAIAQSTSDGCTLTNIQQKTVLDLLKLNGTQPKNFEAVRLKAPLATVSKHSQNCNVAQQLALTYTWDELMEKWLDDIPAAERQCDKDTIAEYEPELCMPCGSGIILPWFGEKEHDWPRAVQVVLYVLGLFWAFAGVAIVADVFMQAIERVTSTKKKVWVDVNGEMKQFHYRVWNDTISNLTLMALGSSAPEILLNVIEITIQNGFFAGSLGPGTIVGSAAFNLLVIAAVCVAAIPSPSTRKINDLSVYSCTSFFSLFAYFWIVVILKMTSPNIIEPWEAVLTFLFFPLMVLLAYGLDTGFLQGLVTGVSRSVRLNPKVTDIGLIDDVEAPNPHLTKEELAAKNAKAQSLEIRSEVRKICADDENMPEAVLFRLAVKLWNEHKCSGLQAVKLAHIELKEALRKSRAHYRKQATSKIFGPRHIVQSTATAIADDAKRPQATSKLSIRRMLDSKSASTSTEAASLPSVGLTASTYGALENSGAVAVTVQRNDLAMALGPVTVEYATMDGSAKAGEHFVHSKGTLMLGKDQLSNSFTVELIDNKMINKDHHFLVTIRNPVLESGGMITLGTSEAKVCIVEDEDPGMLSFEFEKITCEEGCGSIDILVLRQTGSSGKVCCNYATSDGSAIAPNDYLHVEGVLEFEDGETSKIIQVPIIDDNKAEEDETFLITIDEASGGARFDSTTDGSSESCICEVTIISDKIAKTVAEKIHQNLGINQDAFETSIELWKEQFISAVKLQYDETDGSPGVAAYAMHALTAPWKLVFATIPPTSVGGGWPCFFMALAHIGWVTLFIAELAGAVGCAMFGSGSAAITAITFVALGTSLPDTFASKQAAEQDPYADASIGNITGSNSVNVFLGLGLPWLIAAIYWEVTGQTEEWKLKVPTEYHDKGGFYVDAGSLAFSVIVFLSCAILCIGTLALRRKYIGGELGGPAKSKYLSAGFICSLWFVYIGISILEIKGVIEVTL